MHFVLHSPFPLSPFITHPAHTWLLFSNAKSKTAHHRSLNDDGQLSLLLTKKKNTRQRYTGFIPVFIHLL